MGFKKVIGILSLIVISYVVYGIYTKFSDGEAPELNPNPYWGRGLPPKAADNSIRPFKINVEEKILEDLKQRLTIELAGDRFGEPLEGIGFQYGFNSKFLKTLSTHWLHNYNWRKREAALNTYPHFKTNIAGIDIHFQHIKKSNAKKGEKTVPLLLLHGWPGSFVEFQKAIPLLMKSDINFELVIPSLPGYGFSEGGHKAGLGPVEMGQIFLKLMQRLGHESFYVQGGDWGAGIATNMGALYPKNVKGLHLNMCYTMHPRAHLRLLLANMFPTLLMTEEERNKFTPFFKHLGKTIRESGYFHLQATKPDTVGAGLNQSPSGLAAYLLEKVTMSTNEEWLSKENGGITPYYDLNEWLDNVMVYWVTNSFTTSARLYSEAFRANSKQFEVNRVPVRVPTAYLSTPNEPVQQPFFILGDKFPNIVRHTKAAKGGHFAAFEVPDIFTEDVIASIHFFENLPGSKKQEL